MSILALAGRARKGINAYRAEKESSNVKEAVMAEVTRKLVKFTTEAQFDDLSGGNGA